MNDDALFWLAVLALPSVGALHRYAVSYGFRGVTHAQAFGEACRVAMMLGLVSAAFAMRRFAQN